MIITMIDNSVHFMGVVADFFTSGVGLVFAGLIVMICAFSLLKSLISFR